MNTKKKKTIIGCEEWFSLKDLGIPVIKARVDTGAATSSMHAYNIKPFTRMGKTWVRFEAHPIQKNRKTIISCEAPVVGQRTIKSSSGHPEQRYVIETAISYDHEHWNIEVTLTNRDSMGYRMLLGRQAMNGRMMVDPEKSFLLGVYSREEVKQIYKNR